MAQLDTGLGWSAKDGWLKLAPTELCTIGSASGVGYTNQPLPIVEYAADPYVGGFRGYDYRSNYVLYHRYFCAWGDYTIFTATAGGFSYAISPTSGAIMAYGNVRDGASGSLAPYRSVTCNQYDTTYNLYYGQFSGVSSPIDSVIPEFNTLADALAAISVSTQKFYKLNNGYAVSGIIKWITPDGTEQQSPVLISTDENAVKLSIDGETEYPYTYTNIRNYDGRTFYMSLILNLSGDLTQSLVPVADLSQFGAAAPSKVFALLADDSFANIVVLVSPDPYQEGDGSEPGGDDGEEDEEDEVDFTDPPSTSIGATGFLTIFCPSLTELRSLASFMWSSFDVDNWRKLFANPMDAILGLHIIPVPAVISGTKAVKVGGIDTTIDMSYTTIRYIRRSMGTCEIPKKWGAYLDYNPYTKLSIFLPYIGFKEIDADDVMGKTIALQYIIDILTGACVAELKCGDTVMYSWQGNCANEVPISGSDWRGAITSALGIAATVATTVATGGASAPLIAGTVASVGANSLNLKPTINRSGSISGSAGFIGNQRPYIIRTIPNLVIPADQNKYIGYPSFVTMSLGSLTGYNEIASVHLEGIPATGAELDELESILRGGAIF